jgi:hypothetical protein
MGTSSLVLGTISGGGDLEERRGDDWMGVGMMGSLILWIVLRFDMDFEVDIE